MHAVGHPLSSSSESASIWAEPNPVWRSGLLCRSALRSAFLTRQGAFGDVKILLIVTLCLMEWHLQAYSYTLSPMQANMHTHDWATSLHTLSLLYSMANKVTATCSCQQDWRSPPSRRLQALLSRDVQAFHRTLEQVLPVRMDSDLQYMTAARGCACCNPPGFAG